MAEKEPTSEPEYEQNFPVDAEGGNQNTESSPSPLRNLSRISEESPGNYEEQSTKKGAKPKTMMTTKPNEHLEEMLGNMLETMMEMKQQFLETIRKNEKEINKKLERIEEKFEEHVMGMQAQYISEIYKETEPIKNEIKQILENQHDTVLRIAAAEVTVAQQRLSLAKLEKQINEGDNRNQQIPREESTRIPAPQFPQQSTLFPQHVEFEEEPTRPQEYATNMTTMMETSMTRIKIRPPTFDGSGRTRPMKFINEFRRYCQVTRPSLCEIKYLLSTCLERAAREWWALIEDQVHDLATIEQKFIKRFWSHEVQRKVRKNLEFGFYKNDGNLRKVEYAIRLFGSAKDLIPPPSDKEVVESLAQHFTDEIRATIIGRGFETLEDLMEFLEKIDQGGQINAKRGQNGNSRQNQGQEHAKSENGREQKPYRMPNNNQRNPQGQQRPWQNNKNDRNNNNRKEQVNHLVETPKSVEEPKPSTSKEGNE